MSSNLWIFLLSLLKRLEKCAKISVEWQEITSSGDLLSAEVNMNNWKRMFKRVWVLAPDQVLYQEAKPIFPLDIWRIFGWTEFGFCLLNNYKRAYFFYFSDFLGPTTGLLKIHRFSPEMSQHNPEHLDWDEFVFIDMAKGFLSIQQRHLPSPWLTYCQC